MAVSGDIRKQSHFVVLQLEDAASQILGGHQLLAAGSSPSRLLPLVSNSIP